MGQKTHPLGFRLGITESHKSTWYTNFKMYSALLEEDALIREYFNPISSLNQISNIIINRNSRIDQIRLDIESGKPGLLVGKNGSGLKKLLEDVKKILPVNRKISINIFEINPINASILGDIIVDKLEKRIAFRRAIRETLQQAQKECQPNGIKIQVSGRLNGAEIARSEWVRVGRVPLQTLRAQIDYATKEAHTIYGVLGIKIWLFKSEIIAK